MFAPLSRCVLWLSKLPKCNYLWCSRPCPGDQSVAFYTVRAPAQVGFPALEVAGSKGWVGVPTLEVTKMLLFTMFAPLTKWVILTSKLLARGLGGRSCSRSYQSIAIYNVRATAQVGVCEANRGPAPAQVGYSRLRSCQVIRPTIN